MSNTCVKTLTHIDDISVCLRIMLRCSKLIEYVLYSDVIKQNIETKFEVSVNYRILIWANY